MHMHRDKGIWINEVAKNKGVNDKFSYTYSKLHVQLFILFFMFDFY